MRQQGKKQETCGANLWSFLASTSGSDGDRSPSQYYWCSIGLAVGTGASGRRQEKSAEEDIVDVHTIETFILW